MLDSTSPLLAQSGTEDAPTASVKTAGQSGSAGMGATQTPRLALDGVSLSLSGTRVLEDVSFSVRAGEVVCLLGPSGCGKSTTLRAISGLLRPDTGTVRIDGTAVASDDAFIQPEGRGVGLVFQDHALFPHLTVLQNVTFGLRTGTKKEREEIARHFLRLVGMERYADQAPTRLSGGEQQRVALARALAPRPAIMLLDEPFSSLDGRLRETVRDEMMGILQEFDTATVIVTHDPEEAMRLGDRVVLMRDGRVAQFDTPSRIYNRPVDLHTARFFSCVNCFHGTVRNGCVETSVGLMSCQAPDFVDGTAVVVGFRPHGLRVARPGTAQNANGKVLQARYLGDQTLVEMALEARDDEGDTRKICVRMQGLKDYGPGDAVQLIGDPDEAMIFSRQA